MLMHDFKNQYTCMYIVYVGCIQLLDWIRALDWRTRLLGAGFSLTFLCVQNMIVWPLFHT